MTKKCECGMETLSFLDVVNHKGLMKSRPCCHKCLRKLRKGARLSRNGDIVVGQVLMRFHNREYKPMGLINFLFALAEK